MFCVNIGIVLTSDGSFTDFSREEYEEVEERLVEEMKGLNKPFVLVLNSYSPFSPVVVVAINSFFPSLFEYKFTVKSIAGDRIGDVTIEIYFNGEYVTKVVTDLIGNAKIELPEKAYTAKATGLSKGLSFEGEVAIKKGQNLIELTASVIKEELPENQLFEREKYWIKYYNSFNDGYNETIGGDTGPSMPGELNPSSKLEEKDIITIRQLQLNGKMPSEVYPLFSHKIARKGFDYVSRSVK